MARCPWLGKPFFFFMCGIICITGGALLIKEKYLFVYLKSRVNKELPLLKGTTGYELWSTPILLDFNCYLFNVTNPEDVMQGENPNLVEVGPFSYTETYSKHIMDIDEEKDEITFMSKNTYTYNKRASVQVNSRDKVTILNPAYLGSISALTQLPATFMEQYGNHIPKLFPNPKSIFLTTKPNDLFFNGVKIQCNPKRYPELALICSTLQSKRPPILRETEKEGVYLFSFYENMNGSLHGPFTISRGSKNVSKLAEIVAFKGKPLQNIWRSKECNEIRGSDSISWAPMEKAKPSVSTFIDDICRAIDADYQKIDTINGMKGFRFVVTEKLWEKNASECYCLGGPEKCAPGLLDLSTCQEGPLFFSEPHFLHGDPSLLQYARGLKPQIDLHETYIFIEPLTGTPLSGQKRSQLNLKLSRAPVDLLANVSEGYFPLLWCENGNTPDAGVTAYTYQTLRILRLIKYINVVPLIVGVYIILATLYLYSTPRRKVRPLTTLAESILLTSSLRMSTLIRPQRGRPTPRCFN